MRTQLMVMDWIMFSALTIVMALIVSAAYAVTIEVPPQRQHVPSFTLASLE